MIFFFQTGNAGLPLAFIAVAISSFLKFPSPLAPLRERARVRGEPEKTFGNESMNSQER
jgi:hypothetical protein